MNKLAQVTGPSIGFKNMNSNILKQKNGGNVYNVVYPAAFDQNSDLGTADIVRKVKEVVGQNPAECIILQGYSQGASATCDALPELTGPAFDAVKGVVLLGNPEHRPDLTCNVDLYGGKSTRKAVGFFGTKGGIPSEWASKSLDVCNFGDGVCDSAHGIGITLQHFGYIFSPQTQSMGAKFMLKKLALGA
ncbi:Cutinase [Akanthomyces lecanii RCEF 1005]|uniref:Cutinase n=1 Tax=Akanthomyces lecanii RCEF 1005 TaxID=1081108 RepID=A0A168KXJ7_CORDF|nr:Cutinase [Akanthomyces lecanii RCEF 1005]